MIYALWPAMNTSLSTRLNQMQYIKGVGLLLYSTLRPSKQATDVEIRWLCMKSGACTKCAALQS